MVGSTQALEKKSTWECNIPQVIHHFNPIDSYLFGPEHHQASAYID